jgi:hypothetical protein
LPPALGALAGYKLGKASLAAHGGHDSDMASLGAASHTSMMSCEGPCHHMLHHQTAPVNFGHPHAASAQVYYDASTPSPPVTIKYIADSHDAGNRFPGAKELLVGLESGVLAQVHGSSCTQCSRGLMQSLRSHLVEPSDSVSNKGVLCGGADGRG